MFGINTTDGKTCAQYGVEPRVTLIARGEDKGRQIVNKQEIVEMMHHVGHTNITTAVMEYIPLSKQIEVGPKKESHLCI